MKMQSPDVSIIVRTCQRPAYLFQALTSLVLQDYSKFEVVIIEDGPPVSKVLLSQFKKLKINYMFTGSPVGRSKAANIGLSHAKGKYINFLDDDDVLLPQHISSLVKVLNNYQEIDVVHAASIERKITVTDNDPLNYSIVSEKVKYYKPLDHQRIFFENMFPIQAVMFRRTLYEQYGGIDESLELLEDWDLWIKYSMHGKFIYIDDVTSIYYLPSDKTTLRERHKKLKQYENIITNKYSGYVKEKKYKPVNKVRKLFEKINKLL